MVIEYVCDVVGIEGVLFSEFDLVILEFVIVMMVE